MMGLSEFHDPRRFHHKTISDNVCHVDADLLEKINGIMVRHGRAAIKKKGAERLEVKIDSYVLESNVRHPTDCNLLWDAVRKCVELIGSLHEGLGLPVWRKAKYWKRQIKNAMRACEKMASAGGANKEERLRKSAGDYLSLAGRLEETQEQAQCDRERHQLPRTPRAEPESRKGAWDPPPSDPATRSGRWRSRSSGVFPLRFEA